MWLLFLRSLRLLRLLLCILRLDCALESAIRPSAVREESENSKVSIHLLQRAMIFRKNGALAYLGIPNLRQSLFKMVRPASDNRWIERIRNREVTFY